MRVILILFIIPFLFVAQLSFASRQDNEILGKWISENKDVVIDISRCGDNFCGDVVWTKRGASATDERNPNPGLRSRPIFGLRIVSDLAYKGQSMWKGNIYNPQNGSTYKAELRPISANRLSMRGYIGTPIFGKTLLWTRAQNWQRDADRLVRSFGQPEVPN
jgi:uncharacterized protein (DUF2147 family)